MARGWTPAPRWPPGAARPSHLRHPPAARPFAHAARPATTLAAREALPRAALPGRHPRLTKCAPPKGSPPPPRAAGAEPRVRAPPKTRAGAPARDVARLREPPWRADGPFAVGRPALAEAPASQLVGRQRRQLLH